METMCSLKRPTGCGKSYCFTLLPVVFQQQRSTFNHHRRLISVDSADYGTGLHKADSSGLAALGNIVSMVHVALL